MHYAYRRTRSLHPGRGVPTARFGGEGVDPVPQCPVTQVLLRRAFSTFGAVRNARLAQLSVSHLYNLRASELVASVERISEAYLLPVIEKLRVEFTRSRPRQTNDNALAESKNGAVIRKIMGYSHRPCYFVRDTIDATGTIKKTYPRELIMTPWQRLLCIHNYETYLKL
jgi:hypothetical protein